MLSVNRILIFLFIWVFSSSLYAVDVSNFDIKGIKLGMSEKQVLKKMPCSNPIKNLDKYSFGISGSYLTCGKYSESKSFMSVTFDHNQKAYSIHMDILFDANPNLQKIKNKFVKKYGNFYEAIENPTYKNPANGYVKRFCWGSCRKYKIDDGAWKGYKFRRVENKQSQLLIKYENFSYKSNYYNHLEFTLIDSRLEIKQKKWAEKQGKIYRKQQKEKASNIDF